jgi:uncharacterized membrane protein YcaP (DUF421 family)
MDEIVFMLFKADAKEITWWAMCIRGVMIFLLAIAMIKVGGKRMFSKYGAFDIVISLMLGTMLGKAVVGSAKFLPTIITSFLLVLLHRLLSRITFYNKTIGKFIKGEATLIAKDGQFLQEPMKQNNISEKDILEALRSQAELTDITQTFEVYIERSGKISIIPKSK